MKTIESVSIWDNGTVQEANLLNAYIINDNLATSCTFYYSLNASGVEPNTVGQSLAQGNVTMDGENYWLWNGNNDDAYSYIAVQLNLTITGDYVPPQPITEE